MNDQQTVAAATAVDARSGDDWIDALLERSNLTRRQLLLYLGQQASGVLLYDAIWAIELRGINLHAFERAFRTLVNSCDALRTIIEERDGIPSQRVRPRLSFTIPQFDLRAHGGRNDVDDWIRQRCESHIRVTECLFDTALLQTSDAEHTWYLNLHHVIADGWAGEVLVHAFFALYERARRGELPDLVPLPSFQHYASQVRARRSLPAYRDAETYWRRRLAAPLEMPRFYGRTRSGRTTSKARITIDLGEVLTARMKAFATRDDVFVKSVGATMTNVCAALMFAYAYRTTGVRRLALGVAFHNRISQEQKALVGLVVEVLPFVVTLDPDESFLSLVRRVHTEAREALRHRDYSVGNPAQAPVYDMFLNSIRTIQIDEGVGRARRVFPGFGDTSFSITAEDVGDSDDLRLHLDVSRDLTDDIGNDVIARHFRTLLEAAVANPDRSVGSLAIVDQTERRQLTEWNQTAVEIPRNRCVHQMFEAQAARTPHAPAVVDGTTQLTFAELDRRANQLAHYLMRLGVDTETLVGIHMPRSLDLIVAVLGVLKAGCAYVPMDPSYPAERLNYLLHDADVRVVLTQADLQKNIVQAGVRIVCVDSERAIIAAERQDSPVCDVAPGNLAYVIYTSGSTGRPKGVMIEHQSVCNYLLWRSGFFPLTTADALLQTASIGFDDSVWEIFEPLTTGARLVLVEPGREHDVSHLARLVERHRITAACFVPSQLQAFLEAPGIDTCTCLRRVTTGGETLSPELEQRFFARLPAARLYNGYGPTEATISATFSTCCPARHRRTVPIGRPIANTRVYVLDHDRQMVPIGVPGELYIGGVGLARGYLNRPALTAERFVPDPFGDEPGGRLYRTGDLGCWRPDGELEFIGRLDHQVKLRGFRIELGEIEAALRQHPSITDAVVVLHKTSTAHEQLVGYVAADGDAVPTSELRTFLGRTLPRHMIPTAFVTLDRLPLGPSGKVDRSALPPKIDRDDTDPGFLPPRTKVEETLARLWADVLRCARVGIADDFFELGGDSLLAVQLFLRIEEVFDRHLTLSMLFEGATIADMARRLEAAQAPHRDQRIVPIQPQGSRPALYLLPSLTGDFLHWRELVELLGSDQPCYGLPLPGNQTQAEPLSTLEDMAAYCVEGLRERQPHGPYRLAGFSFGGKLAFEMAQQLHAHGEQVTFLGIIDTGFKRRATISSFLRNAVWWTSDDFLHTPRQQMFLRLRQRMRSIGRSARPDDIWQMNRLPESTRSTIERHFRAVVDYVPQSYSGRVTLFRARAQPLLDPGAHDLGWGALCAGGVHVERVAGNHDTILLSARVQVLAERFARCLQATS